MDTRAMISAPTGRMVMLRKARDCAGWAAILIVCLALLALSAGPSLASEGGSSFYLLGQRGQGAGILPPVEGVFFSVPNYFYSGHESGSQSLPIGGTVSLGVDADVYLALPTVLWVTPVDVLGGDLAFSATYVYGNADTTANLAVSIPGIVSGSVGDSDNRWTSGDPVVGAMIGWHEENLHYLLVTTVNIPVIGTYDTGRLSNIALNRWAGDITAAATWLAKETAIELSGAAGVTFNGENDDTDYRTGTESHFEAAAFYNFSKLFSAGLNGFYYQQLTGDSGAGAALGSFKGRVAALGPGLTANLKLGPVPVTVNFRYFREFNAKNRLEGDSGWLTVSIPLWVPDTKR